MDQFFFHFLSYGVPATVLSFLFLDWSMHQWVCLSIGQSVTTYVIKVNLVFRSLVFLLSGSLELSNAYSSSYLSSSMFFACQDAL